MASTRVEAPVLQLCYFGHLRLGRLESTRLCAVHTAYSVSSTPLFSVTVYYFAREYGTALNVRMVERYELNARLDVGCTSCTCAANEPMCNDVFLL